MIVVQILNTKKINRCKSLLIIHIYWNLHSTLTSNHPHLFRHILQNLLKIRMMKLILHVIVDLFAVTPRNNDMLWLKNIHLVRNCGLRHVQLKCHLADTVFSFLQHQKETNMGRITDDLKEIRYFCYLINIDLLYFLSSF